MVKSSEHLSACWLIFFYLLVRAVNQVLFKLVAISSNGYLAVVTSPVFYFCCFLFVLQAVVWVKVLQTVPLSTAYPITSLIFVFILLSGSFFFDEPIDIGHILGTVIIICGVLVIAEQGKSDLKKKNQNN